jgi:predicted RNase H-like nuclease (RuvC/YqgF family)
MTTNLPRLGVNVHEALTRLDTFRPTEARILRREITRLRRTIANRATEVEILPQDLVDLASKLDQMRRARRATPCPSTALVDVVVTAGWTPPKGTG